MLTVTFIREQKERVIEGLNKRFFSDIHLVDKVIEIDDQRKSIKFELQIILAIIYILQSIRVLISRSGIFVINGENGKTHETAKTKIF